MPALASWRGVLLLAGLLAACDAPGADRVPLAYEPTAPVPLSLSRPLIAMGPVTDDRAGPCDGLGIATGNPGFPELPLTGEPAAARAVGDAFTAALMARGWFSPHGSRFALTVRIVRLDAGESWMRHATADFVVTLARRNTGRIVYTDEVRSAGADAGPFSLDSAAYVPLADIAALTQRTMDQAIDQALDKPGFLAALRG